MKYVAVVGGSVSGLGKGITISSIGRLLLSGGLRVSAIKIDPYLNIDAGTMSPFEHGEVFVLDDGGEGDLDLGNYERFLNVRLTKDHNITTGKVYNEVITRERRGDYLGKTVQVVPHVTNEIQEWITRVSNVSVDGESGPADVCLLEFGGTVGDIESGPFLEALRQFQFRVGRVNICIIFVTFVPVLSGEQKTKPTQAGVRDLRAVGLSPDLIVCRSKHALEASVRQKISDFCHVSASDVVSVHDVSNIYHVPLMLAQQDVHESLRKKLMLDTRMRPRLDLTDWSALAHAVDGFEDEVRIAIVGKYTGMADAYLSVIKALKHAGFKARMEVKLVWVEASTLESESKSKDAAAYKEAWQAVRDADGVLVPGGFGNRGVEGKVLTVQYARTAKKPILGICLGFQVMVIEHARNVLGWKGANSEEFAKASADPAVVVFMPEIDPHTMGGNMRLGSRTTLITAHLPSSGGSSSSGSSGKQSLASLLHDDAKQIMERHRHRYEVNPEKVAELEKGGLYFTGRDETGTRMEIVERDRNEHPFFFGVQYHPEFQSRPLHPSPPFYGLIMAASNQLHQLASGATLSRKRSESFSSASGGGGPAPSPLIGERKRSSSVFEEEPPGVLKRANTVDVSSFPL